LEAAVACEMYKSHEAEKDSGIARQMMLEATVA
jgi:hypothetical protein